MSDSPQKYIIINWYPLFICNQVCSYCYARERFDWGKPYKGKPVLNFLETISKSDIPTKLTLLGGEPTLIHNLPSVIEHWNSICGDGKNYLEITTNGHKDKTYFEKTPFFKNVNWAFAFHPENVLDVEMFFEKVSILRDRGFTTLVNILLPNEEHLIPKLVKAFEIGDSLGLDLHPGFLENGHEEQVCGNLNTEDIEFFSKLIPDFFNKKILYKEDSEITVVRENFNAVDRGTKQATVYDFFSKKSVSLKGKECNHLIFNVDPDFNIYRTCLGQKDYQDLKENLDFFKDISKQKKIICPCEKCSYLWADQCWVYC